MAADGTIVDLVRDELRRISDRGELASRQVLQEAVGVGAGDLQAALDVLRDAGEATEVEPDGYRLGVEEEAALDVPAAEAGWSGAPEPEPGVTLAEATAGGVGAAAPLGRRQTAVQIGQYREEYSSAQVTMPRAVADVLDAAALGALLKAGIDTAAAGETFVFEVTP